MYPTQETLKKFFDYDPETGVLTNKIHRNSRSKAGTRAGTVDMSGYRFVYFDCTRCLEHILIWIFLYGEKPEGKIDHKNTIRDDNRADNLRLATNLQNAGNKSMSKANKSGYKNINWSEARGKWEVSLKIDGKKGYFKRFVDLDEAIKAANDARVHFFGEFANHG